MAFPKKYHLIAAWKKAQQNSGTLFRVSAIGLNENGDVVDKAFNRSRFKRMGGGLHAEQQIFARAKRKGVKTIIICRIGRRNSILPIDPCPACAEKARELGIKIYSVKAADLDV